MCIEKQAYLGSDEMIEQDTWQIAQLNANTLKMMAALKEQELFDEALQRAQAIEDEQANWKGGHT